MSAAEAKPKRFYKDVLVEADAGRFCVRLDARTLKTPQGNELSLVTRSLADAIATEWREQSDEIDRTSMPLTAIAISAADTDAPGRDILASDILNYLESDLLCYRADGPAALVQRQCEAWDPLLEWFEDETGVKLAVTSGIMSIAQPANARSILSTALENMDTQTILALRTATAISGSAVIAFAVTKECQPPADLYAASRVDEIFQAEKWGQDDEAEARNEKIRNEFLSIARFLKLVTTDG